VSIIADQPTCVRQPSKRSKWYLFNFPPAFIFTYYVLFVRVWDSATDNYLKTRPPTPDVPEGIGMVIFAVEMRAILIVVLFVLCLPFIPAVRRWEPGVVGALSAVFTSVLDFEFWKFGLNRFNVPEYYLAAIGFPALSCGLAILLLRYVKKRLRSS
jgi:hypothetical protein